MALPCLIRFDPTFSWDGVFTLIGGVLVIVGVWWQISDVKTRGERRKQEVARSTMTGILGEIDWFYRYHLAASLASLRKFDPEKGLRELPQLRSDPFPVFTGTTARLGDLPFKACTVILSFYGPARDLANRLRQYADYYEEATVGDIYAPGLAGLQVENVKKHCEAVIQVAYTTCGTLCHFWGLEFTFPAVGVADDKNVTEESRNNLSLLVQDLEPLGSE